VTEIDQPVSLKVDVDTHDGMRDGVPNLLDAFRAAGVRATFFLSFGPDNSGKAVLNVLRQPGFLKKMVRTGAPSLYGWRTILSGTLLPARPIATKFPDIVRRIEEEGHEVAVHAWDHRLWQDHLEELDSSRIEAEFERSFGAFETILGRRSRAVAAPAWFETAASLQVQDGLGLLYASDLRGGVPCYPVLDGYRSTTLQLPTSQPCLEELLTQGERDLARCVRRVLDVPSPFGTRVLPLHAEVEGGVFRPFLQLLLDELVRDGTPTLPLEELARAELARQPPPGELPCALSPCPGRAGRVFMPAEEATARA
jgi:hypothetical protein